MATVYKCDKCGKVIKDRISANSLYYTTFGGSEICEKYNIPGNFNLCHACSPALAKLMAKFFNDNGRKKANRVKK
jgi:hypothetical protein